MAQRLPSVGACCAASRNRTERRRRVPHNVHPRTTRPGYPRSPAPGPSVGDIDHRALTAASSAVRHNWDALPGVMRGMLDSVGASAQTALTCERDLAPGTVCSAARRPVSSRLVPRRVGLVGCRVRERVGAENTSVWVDLGFCLSADRNALGFGNYAICPNRPAIRLSVSSIETREFPSSIRHSPSLVARSRPRRCNPSRRRWPRIRSPHRDTAAMRAPTRPRPRPPTGGRYGRIA